MVKRESFRPLFFLVMAVLYLIAFFTDLDIYLNDKAAKHGVMIHRSFGGRLKYLTYIDMVCYLIQSNF